MDEEKFTSKVDLESNPVSNTMYVDKFSELKQQLDDIEKRVQKQGNILSNISIDNACNHLNLQERALTDSKLKFLILIESIKSTSQYNAFGLVIVFWILMCINSLVDNEVATTIIYIVQMIVLAGVIILFWNYWKESKKFNDEISNLNTSTFYSRKTDTDINEEGDEVVHHTITRTSSENTDKEEH